MILHLGVGSRESQGHLRDRNNALFRGIVSALLLALLMSGSPPPPPHQTDVEPQRLEQQRGEQTLAYWSINSTEYWSINSDERP